MFAFHTVQGSRERALRRRGWTPKNLGPNPSAEALRNLSATDVLVVGVEPGEQGERTMAELERWRETSPSAALVLFLAQPDQAIQRWAMELTLFNYTTRLTGDPFSRLIAQVLRLWTAPVPEEQDQPPMRRVTIRLGEGMEVDGMPVRLGLAARNFLYELAATKGERIPRDRDIAAGPGYVSARECRRRLGRQAGPELIRLLIPREHGDPYRFREPDEILRVSSDPATEHVPTLLRIVGRSGVRTTTGFDLDTLGGWDGQPPE